MPLYFLLVQIDPNEIARRTLHVNEGTLGVLILTLIVLGAYTLFTFWLYRKVAEQVEAANAQTRELINQRRLSVLPAFIVYLKEGMEYNRPKIVNVGRGVALNIQIERVPLVHEQYRDKALTLRALPPYCQPGLQPGSEPDLLVAYEGFAPEERPHQDPKVSRFLNNEKYDLHIRFSDIEGRTYAQTLRMDAGKCSPEPVSAEVNAHLNSQALARDAASNSL